MILVGIDPSFSCSGVSVIDTDSKNIRISDVRKKIGRKNFENVFWTGLEVHKGIREIIESVGKPDILISEKPFSGGSFSSGLHALDATLFLDLYYRYKSLKKVYLISARFLTQVHKANGIKDYSKSDSTNLVRNQLLPIFEEVGYDVKYGIKYDEKKEYKGGLNNNTAESFIFLVRLFISLNDKIDINNEGKLIDNIYNTANGIFKGKEDLLFDKKDID